VFHPEVTSLITPSKALAKRASRFGLQEEQVIQAGTLLVRPEFSNVRSLDKEALRVNLGLIRDRRTVLLMGGGAGVNQLEVFARALSRTLPRRDAQLVIICGKNEALRSRLLREFNTSSNGQMPVHVLGFTREVPRWMRAADLLVTKAGPSTIVEALTVGLPVLLFDFLPGQERGNVDFVVREGVGGFAPSPRRVADTVQHWLFDDGGAILEDMTLRARNVTYGRDPAGIIVTEAAKLAQQHFHWMANHPEVRMKPPLRRGRSNTAWAIKHT